MRHPYWSAGSVSFVLTLSILAAPLGSWPHQANGDDWRIYLVDAQGKVGEGVSIALDGNGNPHMSYSDSHPNWNLKYARWDEGSWNVEIVDPNDTGVDTSIAIDGNGNPHIGYYGNSTLRYAKWNGSSWEMETVDATPNVGNFASLALDSGDNPHMSYSGKSNLKYARWNGSAWVTETVDSDLDVGRFNSLALDSHDNPHIAYMEDTGWNLKYANKSEDSWTVVTVDNTTEAGEFASLALDSEDDPHISYHDDINGDLKYAEWVEDDWDIVTVDTGELIGHCTSIALDSNDDPHISYGDSYDHDLWYAVREAGAWSIEIVDWIEGVGGFGYTSITLDAEGNPHIGYYDGTNRDLKYATKGFLPGPDGPPVADAGPDQTVNEGDTVQFDGSGSYVPGKLSFELTEPIRINNVTAGDQRSMSIAKNSQGHILVAWRDERDPGQGDIYFAKSVNGGMSFEGNVKAAADIRVKYFPSEPRMAVDSEDNIYLVWRSWSESGDNTSIMLSRSMDGGQAFDNPILVNEPIGKHVPRSIPSIAVGKNDTLHVSWHEVPGPDEQVCVVKSEDRGESFGPCVVASSPTGGGAHWGNIMTSLAADREGNVYVAWRSHHYNNVGRDDIFVSRSVDGGDSFETQVNVSDWEEDTNMGNFWPTILAGPEGMVYVVWLDSRDRTPTCFGHCDVYFSRSTDYGETFEPNVRVNDNSSELAFQYSSMALDSCGNPYVAWTTWPNSTIYIDRSIDKGETFGEDLELLVNWSDHLAHLGSVTLTDDGTLHVAWNLLEREIQEYPHLYDVYYSHSLTSVTSGNLTYEWDFDAAADGDSNGNSTDDMDATGSAPTWTYGDNGNFTVTLKVTDDLGNWDTDTMNLTVLNVAPEVSANHTCSGGGPTDIMLRIAGEKWHDVTFAIFEDGNEIHNETLVREPGSPNEQMIGLEGFALNGSRSYSVVAYYTPEDDPVNGQVWGATPAWIILRSGGNETARLHHTFNVRHPGTWLWRVDDLGSYLPSRECIFTAYASDPGSDDLIFTWDFGDGAITEHVYYNDGIGPDPFPSPEINPANAADEAKHSYASAGSYTVTLTVTDDDGGVSQVTLVVDV